MKLYEIASSKTISTAELVALVKKIHHTPQDFNDGDLYDRLYQFEKYNLEEWDVSKLKTIFDVDPDRLDAFTKMDLKNMPPIVWDPINDVVIDGGHRLETLKKLGIKKAMVYTGDKSTYTPLEDEDEE